MKKIMLGCGFLLLMALSCMGQCGKKSVLTSSKTEYLNAAGALQRSVDEKSEIKFSKTAIILKPGEDALVTGIIDSDSCNWKLPFKEGKSIIKARMTDPGGDTKQVTFFIEGKNGKIILLAEVEGMPDRKIRLTADLFEEEK